MEKKAIIGKKVGMTQIFDEAGPVRSFPLLSSKRAPAPSFRRRPPKRTAMKLSSWAISPPPRSTSPRARRATWPRPALSCFVS